VCKRPVFTCMPSCKYGSKKSDFRLILDVTQNSGAEQPKGHHSLFAGLAKLRMLNLDSCNVTNEGCRHLADLGELREIDLSDSPIGNAGLRHLTGSFIDTCQLLTRVLICMSFFS
jgi:hypothetical protein